MEIQIIEKKENRGASSQERYIRIYQSGMCFLSKGLCDELNLSAGEKLLLGVSKDRRFVGKASEDMKGWEIRQKNDRLCFCSKEQALRLLINFKGEQEGSKSLKLNIKPEPIMRGDIAFYELIKLP